MSIIVIGNAVIDRSFRVQRMPEPGETMIAHGGRVDCGGKGLIQAISAARAGADVRLHATVGDDGEGRMIIAAVTAEGITLPANPTRPGPTDEAIVLVLPDGENAIVCSTHAAHHAQIETGLQAMAGLGSGDWLVCQGNLKRDTTEATLLRARQCGLSTIVNPSPHLFDYAGLWPLIDVVIVNKPESRSLTGCEDLDAAAKKLIGEGCRNLVVTTGGEGARLYRWDREDVFVAAAPAVCVNDTTGAGDTCCGILAAGLDTGIDIENSLAWAVRCAAIAVTRWGSMSALPSRQEIEAMCTLG